VRSPEPGKVELLRPVGHLLEAKDADQGRAERLHVANGGLRGGIRRRPWGTCSIRMAGCRGGCGGLVKCRYSRMASRAMNSSARGLVCPSSSR
jgi:hypothetical protein